MNFNIPILFIALSLANAPHKGALDTIGVKEIQASKQFLVQCKYFKRMYPRTYQKLSNTEKFTVYLDKTLDSQFCGVAFEGVITIFNRSYEKGLCNPLIQLLAHEMLHVVGLHHNIPYEDDRYWTEDKVKIIENTCVTEMEERESKESKSY